MSGLFELLTYPLSLPINPLWEWVIMGLIGTVSFLVAFRFVSILKYDTGLSNGGILSIIHWVVRFIVFFSMWAILCEIIKIIQWIINLFR